MASAPQSPEITQNVTTNLWAEQKSRVGGVLDGEFLMQAVLGRGGNGTVYRALWLKSPDSGKRTPVAVKLLHAGVFDEVVGNPTALKRFEREGAVMARLQHPNIVRIFKLGRTADGLPYMAMELMVGDALDRVLRQRGTLAVSDILTMGEELCRGLSEAHAMGGVVHRDIKPANILLTPEGTAKLADFGIAKSLDDGATVLTADGVIVGSPAFMAPEMLKGGVCYQTDIYQIGLVLYRALVGHNLFTDKSPPALVAKHLAAPPTPPAVDGQPLSGPLVDLILECLRKDPSNRPRSAQVLADRLASLAPASCVVGADLSDRPKLQRAKRQSSLDATQTLDEVVDVNVTADYAHEPAPEPAASGHDVTSELQHVPVADIIEHTSEFDLDLETLLLPPAGAAAPEAAPPPPTQDPASSGASRPLVIAAVALVLALTALALAL